MPLILYFDVIKMSFSDVTDRTSESPQFCVQVTEEMLVGYNCFCHRLLLFKFYLCGMNFCWRTTPKCLSVTSRIEHQKGPQFCVQVTEEMLVGYNCFCHRLLLFKFYLCGVNFCWRTAALGGGGRGVNTREKVWSIGFYPNLFLTYDWYFGGGGGGGKISQQMKK